VVCASTLAFGLRGRELDVSTLPDRIEPVALVASSLVSALGDGDAALADGVRRNRSALAPNRFAEAPLACWTGAVAGLDDTPLPAAWAHWDSRPTRLAWRALQTDGLIDAVAAARQRHGAARVALVLGTSASTIGVSERAYRALAADGGFPLALRSERLNTPHAVAAFVAEAMGLEGPSVTVSTACSSSAKAFATAERWLRLGVADAVLVGGVDALCGSVLYGFNALGLVSEQACRPFDARRNGISVGEAAGFALLEHGHDAPVLLLGYGEANDAHHMSAPHPQGLGAERALDRALARAGLADAAAVDMVSLHGTATPQNDAVEAALVARRYRADVHACAGKGTIGHTMGAAGIAAAALAWLALRNGLAAGSPGHDEADATLPAPFAHQLQRAPQTLEVGVAASHAFGFGGNNVVLLFGCGV
jgi:3-oxoacyl-[acyl-carrier-protein] synthase I